MYNQCGEHVYGIDTNSILFVDRSLLPRPVLIDRNDEWQLLQNCLSAKELNVTEEMFELLKAVHSKCSLKTTAFHLSM